MKKEWLQHSDGNKELVLFFNGWGMDANAVKHLQGAVDVFMFYDYRSLDITGLPDFERYDKVSLIAWSMGVWAAANTLPMLPLKADLLIAINGTERPVDNSYGIPCPVYALTEKGMTEKGREKFFSRMLISQEEINRFENNKPKRELSEQIEELSLIRKMSEDKKGVLNWDRVYISEKDLIFPVQNQRQWWEGKTKIKALNSGHYPFYGFTKWEDF